MLGGSVGMAAEVAILRRSTGVASSSSELSSDEDPASLASSSEASGLVNCSSSESESDSGVSGRMEPKVSSRVRRSR